MDNNRVIVTGGAGDIGTAICERLHSDGLEVVVLDLEKPSHRFATHSIVVDLGDEIALREKVGSFIAENPVCRLVNNAGIVKPATIEETTAADFDLVMRVNLRSAMLLTQLCVPAMRAVHFGRVVNIASRAALGKALRSAYAASKAGLIGLTKTLALELGREGITLNAIGPGPIKTKLFADANPADSPRTKAILDAIPVGYMGEGKDVAAAVSFFISDDSRFVTGQTLYVCGGMTVGLTGN